MNDLEKLIKTIMKEAEKDDEPVTYEEAKEMAEMEIKANKDCKRYEQSAQERKKVDKVRKIDEDKLAILKEIKILVEGMQLNANQTVDVQLKTETELSFNLKGNDYTLKLTKHRPPKKQAVTPQKRGK